MYQGQRQEEEFPKTVELCFSGCTIIAHVLLKNESSRIKFALVEDAIILCAKYFVNLATFSIKSIIILPLDSIFFGLH